MPEKNDDLESILTELKDALSGFSKEEKKQIEQKIEKKIEDLRVPQPPQVITQTAPPPPQPKAPVPAPPPPPVQVTQKQETLSVKQPQPEVPEGTIVLKTACLYPKGQSQTKDVLINNIVEASKKSSKKPLYLDNVFELEVDPFNANWVEVAKKCVAARIEAVFLIHQIEFDSHGLKDKFGALGIFFTGIFVDSLNKRMTYIDLVIELSLSKKSSR